jgi:hypothetical protein
LTFLSGHFSIEFHIIEAGTGSKYGMFCEQLFLKHFTMKFKIFPALILSFLISSAAEAQDTSANQAISKDETYPVSSPVRNYTIPAKPHIYRDTRLGSSSPLYNTYQKNDNGAGAVTTNPHKSNGMNLFQRNTFDSAKDNVGNIYRDTRLGSSASFYNTYQKNDYGAGAITTNPHK